MPIIMTNHMSAVGRNGDEAAEPAASACIPGMPGISVMPGIELVAAALMSPISRASMSKYAQATAASAASAAAVIHRSRARTRSSELGGATLELAVMNDASRARLRG
jgi:hypothetical protein